MIAMTDLTLINQLLNYIFGNKANLHIG